MVIEKGITFAAAKVQRKSWICKLLTIKNIIPGLIVEPGINPLSTDNNLLPFEAEQTENEVIATAMENVGDIQVVIINAMGIVMYNTIERVAADDVIRISTIGWQKGEYMLYIIRDNDAIGGEFAMR